MRRMTIYFAPGRDVFVPVRFQPRYKPAARGQRRSGNLLLIVRRLKGNTGSALTDYEYFLAGRDGTSNIFESKRCFPAPRRPRNIQTVPSLQTTIHHVVNLWAPGADWWPLREQLRSWLTRQRWQCWTRCARFNDRFARVFRQSQLCMTVSGVTGTI